MIAAKPVPAENRVDSLCHSQKTIRGIYMLVERARSENAVGEVVLSGIGGGRPCHNFTFSSDY